MTERDIVVPELDPDGRLTHPAVLDQIAEIADAAASAPDLSGEGQWSVAVGEGATAGGDAAVAIGAHADAPHTGSVAIGPQARSTGEDQIVLGGGDYTVRVPGRLEINEPTSPQQAATKRYADSRAGVPGVLSGPGRPDVPDTTPYTEADLQGAFIYISTDVYEGAAIWRRAGARSWAVMAGRGEIDQVLPAVSILTSERDDDGEQVAVPLDIDQASLYVSAEDGSMTLTLTVVLTQPVELTDVAGLLADLPDDWDLGVFAPGDLQLEDRRWNRVSTPVTIQSPDWDGRFYASSHEPIEGPVTTKRLEIFAQFGGQWPRGLRSTWDDR